MPRTISKAPLEATRGVREQARLTIHIAETTCLTLLGVMKTTSPVDCYVAFASVQTGGAFHASTCADSAKLEEPVKDRAIISNVVFTLLLSKRVHIIWCYLLKEVDVLVSMELGHLMAGGRLGTLQAISRCA